MRLVCLFAILILLTSCQRQPEPTLTLPTLLPQPVYLERSAGIFSLPSSFLVDAPSGPELQPVLKSMSQWALIEGSADPSEAQLVFQERPNLPKEGYQLEVTSDQIVISYSDGAGAFYASQTLRQLLMQAKDNGQLPGMLIRDEPRFPHRGMHLDVGRHFFPPEFIKKYIDLLAMHKMNRFHWHLTEDQGWRIEIKRYPKLQSVAAFRDETLIGHYSDQPHQFDGKRYGGFYTQEEIREIVEYAQERFVTIIPEIDMPGHTQALLAAYPELSCHGKPVKVATKWGVFENVLCPTDTTFRFLEGVLTEVMDLFPGPYIHIGGDECPKTQWENSSFCQELMQREGLADENELQSYFNRRIDAFLTAHGKKLIGWDEILEGGLSPNATVMSWRGTKGGREAAEAGHDVIMSPTSHCYFDYYQSNHPDEPLAIGGFLPLKKVYQYEPIPEGLPVEAHKHILGAQGNVWTEYKKESKQVEYMAFPRAIALAEVVWSPAEVRDYEDFLDRLTHHLPLLDALEVNYAQHWLDINYHLERDSATDQLLLFLENRRQDPMQVTIGRDTPTLYAGPIHLKKSKFIQAQRVDSIGTPFGRNLRLDLQPHQAAGREVSWNRPPHPNYQLHGPQTLVNGLRGSDQRFGDGEWLGWWGEDVTLTIDLGSAQQLTELKVRFFYSPGQWIYLPNWVSLQASEDGETWRPMGEISGFRPMSSKVLNTGVRFTPKTARYWQLKVEHYGKIPEGEQGAGNPAWFFIDEIELR